MRGVQFVTDSKGRKTMVLIDLRKNRVLWEDLQDGLIAESRRNEPEVPLAEVRKSLARSAKVSGKRSSRA